MVESFKGGKGYWGLGIGDLRLGKKGRLGRGIGDLKLDIWGREGCGRERNKEGSKAVRQ
jgi:hypothetical protein